MRLDDQLFTAVLAGGRSENEVEGVFGVESQTGNLGSLYALVLGNDARFGLRLRRSAVARSILSHSSTTDVCVAFLQRRTGALGEERPYVLRMEDWRAAKDFCDADSEDWFRETVMSTIDPEVMDGGRRIEGNSI